MHESAASTLAPFEPDTFTVDEGLSLDLPDDPTLFGSSFLREQGVAPYPLDENLARLIDTTCIQTSQQAQAMLSELHDEPCRPSLDDEFGSDLILSSEFSEDERPTAESIQENIAERQAVLEKLENLLRIVKIIRKKAIRAGVLGKVTMWNRNQERQSLSAHNDKQAFERADAEGLAVVPGGNAWEMQDGDTLREDDARSLTTSINDFVGRLAAKVRRLKSQNFA